MSALFSIETLAEKLGKLNASQQTIENLSHWCIFHHTRAADIVKTWEQQFFAAPKEKRVFFLYLANDIIQNSRRKGSEFVHEFWKVLNGALKNVKANGGESGRNAVSRLISIWEERKVFGARPNSLRDELLGGTPPPELEKIQPQEKQERDKEKHEQTATPSKKLVEASIFSKVTKSFKEVQDGASKENATVEECNSVRRRIGVLENEIKSQVGAVGASGTGELEEQQKNLLSIIDELDVRASKRSKLVRYFKEALSEQEKKLEYIRKQIQAARTQAEQLAMFKEEIAAGTTAVCVEAKPAGAAAGEGNAHKPKERNDASAASPKVAPYAILHQAAQASPPLFAYPVPATQTLLPAAPPQQQMIQHIPLPQQMDLQRQQIAPDQVYQISQLHQGQQQARLITPEQPSFPPGFRPGNYFSR